MSILGLYTAVIKDNIKIKDKRIAPKVTTLNKTFIRFLCYNNNLKFDY